MPLSALLAPAVDGRFPLLFFPLLPPRRPPLAADAGRRRRVPLAEAGRFAIFFTPLAPPRLVPRLIPRLGPRLVRLPLAF